MLTSIACAGGMHAIALTSILAAILLWFVLLMWSLHSITLQELTRADTIFGRHLYTIFFAIGCVLLMFGVSFFKGVGWFFVFTGLSAVATAAVSDFEEKYKKNVKPEKTLDSD